MLKKIILALLLVGFTGILVWGGVNRTLAKSGDTESRGAETAGNGNQGWTEDHNPEDCTEDGYQGGINAPAAEPVSQSQSNGTGCGAAAAKSNGNQPTADSDHLPQGQGNSSRGNGGQGQGGGSREPLDAAEIEALYLALNDEYHALAVYQSVIETFGPVEPFVEIAASEEHHIGALVNQLTKNGLAIPENTWLGTIPPFESVAQACATGVQAEIDNAGLYDQLFSMTDNTSLIRVFTNLSIASLNSHLSQFETCQ
ncbi:MAG TPA: hypothetical protein DEH22_13050 [Chloroflexi bacterium]|nr:hypothetical protein [Chloroflexota bacterium]